MSNRDVILGPVTITLSADKERVYLLVQNEERASTYTQDVMPGEEANPYNMRWAMEMVLRRFVAAGFDRYVVNPPKPKEGLDISIEEDVIE